MLPSMRLNGPCSPSRKYKHRDASGQKASSDIWAFAARTSIAHTTADTLFDRSAPRGLMWKDGWCTELQAADVNSGLIRKADG